MKRNSRTANTVFAALLLPAALLLFTGRLSAAEFPRKTAVVQAVEKVGPAVVNISSEYRVSARRSPFSEFGINPFFDSFFKDFFDPGFEQRAKRTSLGSGVVIDGDRGFILTNAHVISQAESITVLLNDERTFGANVVGADPDSDLAVLKIDASETLPDIEMGDSGDLMIGETVIAIGNPFGFSHTVTTGVISALNRSIRAEDTVFHDFIQTDASINPGNSGGPLLNINGALIGINTAIYAKAQGIGFAIPINKAKRIIADLIQYGEVIMSWTGLFLQTLDSELAAYLKLPFEKGVMIRKVAVDSPAADAGLKAQDLILALDDTPIETVDDFYRRLRSFPVGSTIWLTVLRDGKKQTVSLKTALFPMDRALELAFHLLGIHVENISLKTRFAYQIEAKQGVVITDVASNSRLAGIGVKPGDVIRQIDDFSIASLDDFKTAIAEIRHQKSTVILVQRGDQGYYVTVRL